MSSKGASRNGPSEWADVSSPSTRNLFGRIRRFALGVTSRVKWQIIGHRLLDRKLEAKEAELFGGIGLFARPSSGSKAEAIVVGLGDDGAAPAIVGVRDEGTRAAVVEELGGVDEDETVLFNSATVVYCKSTGVVEVRTPGGAAFALAKASELQALASDFYAHIHAASGAPTSGPMPSFVLPDPPSPVMTTPGFPGTTVLKGE